MPSIELDKIIAFLLLNFEKNEILESVSKNSENIAKLEVIPKELDSKFEKELKHMLMSRKY